MAGKFPPCPELDRQTREGVLSACGAHRLAFSVDRACRLFRLFEQGYSVDRDADAHILVDGVRVEPLRLSETRLSFVLPIRGRDIVLRSKMFVPAHPNPDCSAERELGLAIGRLQIDGETIPIDGCEACKSGWHAPEFDGGRFARRWERGAIALPTGARHVIVELADFGQYWRDPPDSLAALSA